MHNYLDIPGVAPFHVYAKKSLVDKTSRKRNTFPHIHNMCEIYINLSGDVSFMVEGKIYPIRPYDILLTTPFEYHHCIYHSDQPHSLYLILFSPQENPALFRPLLQKEKGMKNLIRLPEELRRELEAACQRLLDKQAPADISLLSSFFYIIRLVEQGLKAYHVESVSNAMPEEFLAVIRYMDEQFRSIGQIREVAERFHISIMTLERYFQKYLGIKPRQYLEDKKLNHACFLLSQGSSGTEACYGSGFNDYSHFIARFRKKFGTTPRKYRTDTAAQLARLQEQQLSEPDM